MLKLRVVQPGKDPVPHEFPGDQAVIGRAPDCDVQVAEPYVSKRHVKVLAGLVVVDLGSSNGTHVAGQRLEEPVILTDGSFRLGTEDDDAVIEVEHSASTAVDAAQVFRSREELDTERRRNASLAGELAELRAARTEPRATPSGDERVAELQRELADARRRIDSLKSEVEERDVEASASVQVRLAQDALAEAQRHNDELRQQLAALQEHAAAPAVEAAREALAGRVAELESERAELHARIESREAELQAARAEAQPQGNVSELFFKLQAENRELRAQLEQARSAPQEGAPQVFFELQAANAKLRARVEELEAAGAAPAPAADATADELAALQQQNHELRLSKADLAAELERLRQRTAAATPTGAAATPPPAAAGGDACAVLQSLVDDDIDGHPPEPDAAVERFVTLEQFRFLRQIERLVTRMASDFIQLYDQRTILPDVAGNLRRLIGAVLEAPDDAHPRHELIGYLDELRKWLVVALGANRRAAERFAEELRSDLSERSLAAAKPMPALKRLTGGVDAELWARASSYLKRLTADVVDEKLQHLSRRCAEELRREQDRG